MSSLSFFAEIGIAKYFSVTKLRAYKYVKSKTKPPAKKKKKVIFSHQTGLYIEKKKALIFLTRIVIE